jgi:hypothetical protein
MHDRAREVKNHSVKLKIPRYGFLLLHEPSPHTGHFSDTTFGEKGSKGKRGHTPLFPFI